MDTLVSTINERALGAIRTNSDIEKLEEMLLTSNAAPLEGLKLEHLFDAPGVYVRQLTMPKGSVIIGHEHTTKHWNVVLKGSATVNTTGGLPFEVKAPMMFVSEAGVRKVLLVGPDEDLVWQTIHPTCETDLNVLEQSLVKKSNAYLKHEGHKALT